MIARHLERAIISASARHAYTLPLDSLERDLWAWWDASRSDLMDLDASGGVAVWRDSVAGLRMVQPVAAYRPVWSPSSFNGRPGVTGDGLDDHLTLAPAPFSANTPHERWAVFQQDAQVDDDDSDGTSAASQGDSLGRQAFSQGNTTNNNALVIGRTVPSSTNRICAYIGEGSTSPLLRVDDLDGSFRHVVRLQVGATRSILTVDGTHVVTKAAVPGSSMARMRLFASSRIDPGSFWLGQITHALICAPLEPVA